MADDNEKLCGTDATGVEFVEGVGLARLRASRSGSAGEDVFTGPDGLPEDVRPVVQAFLEVMDLAGWMVVVVMAREKPGPDAMGFDMMACGNAPTMEAGDLLVDSYLRCRRELGPHGEGGR